MNREELIEKQREEIKALRSALIDMLSGWRYIRSSHGDLYGVGWERAESGAVEALHLSETK